MHVNKFRELTFSAAHYLPNHPRCSTIHGHTYRIRNLELTCDAFVDFQQVKAIIQSFDHVFLVPREHMQFWERLRSTLFEKCGIMLNVRYIWKTPTVEDLAIAIQKELLSISGVTDVHFELYEGDNQGVRV